jgi:drug/metabolite transporter (DMT)-like permease
VPHDQDSSNHPVIGIGFKLASVVLLAGMAACVKQLGAGIPAGQTIFFRGLISMLVIAIVAWRGEGLRLLKTRNWRAHALRSLAGTVSMFCWFAALTMIPLAQMTAISFTIPLFLTLLAMLFLGERIHAYRWTALGIGFAGVIVIVGPQLAAGGGNALGASVGLGAAVSAAFALMFLRRMSGHEHALTITFYFFLTSTVFAGATAAFGGWPAPTPEQWLLIGLTGLLGVFDQLLMTYSYHYAEASLVAPLDYVGLLIAVAIGFYLFDEIPHVATWIGAPLVIVAGLIILWREYAKLRSIRSAPRLVP